MGHQNHKHTDLKVEHNSTYANGGWIEFEGCKCEDLYNRPRAQLPHYNSRTAIIIIIIMQSRLISSRAGKLVARKSFGERIRVHSQAHARGFRGIVPAAALTIGKFRDRNCYGVEVVCHGYTILYCDYKVPCKPA